jgi:hypothetical protein
MALYQTKKNLQQDISKRITHTHFGEFFAGLYPAAQG